MTSKYGGQAVSYSREISTLMTINDLKPSK